MSSKLACKLKGLIEENSLSIQGLEKRAGLKIHAVRNILTGQTKRPSAETLLAVSKALNCSIGELLDEEAPVKENKEKAREFEDLDLLIKVLTFIVEYYNTNSLPLTNQDLFQLTEQAYSYSIKNNQGLLDEGFAEWLLDRELDVL
jgi:transcriptional regulator with XRE-family HTH domain